MDVAMTDTASDPVARSEARPAYRRAHATDLRATGEPFQWAFGGMLALGILMIASLLGLVLWNGVATFWPKRIAALTLVDGARVAGEAGRVEAYRVPADTLARLPAERRAAIAGADGLAERTLYRVGNYDIYNDDFRWVSDFEIAKVEHPAGLLTVERLEWGLFVGSLKAAMVGGVALPADRLTPAGLAEPHATAQARRQAIRHIERDLIGDINHRINRERLRLRSVELSQGAHSAEYARAKTAADARIAEWQKQYETFAAQAKALRDEDAKDTVTYVEIGGKEKTIALSSVVRHFRANETDLGDRVGIYLARWWEFLSTEPREANTEGGILPAIFGTVAMTLLLVVFVAPFGIVTALYLREYARQGRLVSIVRISVNNLAGVPSIVYGVFGLGFFAYLVGGTIDSLFFPERLPNPTFGTGGLLWSSLTLAVLTVPVVIVATEEALAAVPRSMREGALACGASKWQTIRTIVLPRAMPGIMTGIILAMARGMGEVAPLMLVGVVKLAPELPIDGYFPFIHLERSFMHLGFHIYDVGFQSRNSEAGKPMVFVTTLLLILLIVVMNATAIYVRNRLRRRFAGSQF